MNLLFWLITKLIFYKVHAELSIQKVLVRLERSSQYNIESYSHGNGVFHQFYHS